MNCKSFTHNLVALTLAGLVLAIPGFGQDASMRKANLDVRSKKGAGTSALGLNGHLKPKKKHVLPGALPFKGLVSKAPGDTLYYEPFEFANWPADLIRLNLDGKSPGNNPGSTINTQLFGNNAWVTTTQAPDPNRFAASLSWTVQSGAVNRWMVTPPITLTEGNKLRWKARASNTNFPDGYEVRLCTNCPADINATNVVSSFSTLLFTIDEEQSSGQFIDREVSLSAYVGQTVRLAYRNNSNDMDRLYIDDVLVYRVPPVDLTAQQIFSPDTSIYDCAKTNFPVVVSVGNSGSQTAYGITVKVKSVGPIVDSVSVVLDSLTKESVDTVAFTDGLDLSSAGEYDITLSVSGSGDGILDNNTSSTTFLNPGSTSGAFNLDFEELTTENPLPANWKTNTQFLPFNETGGLSGSVGLEIPVFNNLGQFGTFNEGFFWSGSYDNLPAGATLSVKYRLSTLQTDDYQLAEGDSVSIIVLKNCQPTTATYHLTAANQNLSTDYQKLFVPLADLNLTPTDQLNITFRAKAAPATSVYILNLDDVTLGTIADNDIALIDIEVPTNTVIKRNQFQAYQVKGSVFNEGSTTISPVRIVATAAPATLEDTARISSLPGGFSKPFSTTPGLVLTESGEYTISVTASSPGVTDPNADNNTFSFPVTLSDSTMAKDLGEPLNETGLGYGPTVGGKRIMANAISTTARDTLTSVSVFLGTLDSDCRAKAFFANRNAAGTGWNEDSSGTAVDLPVDLSNSWVPLRFRLRTGNNRDRGRAVTPNSTNLYGIKISSGNVRMAFNFENISDDGSWIWLGGQWLGTQDLTIGSVTFFIRPNFGRPSTLVSASQLEQSLNFAELIPNPASGQSQLALMMNKGKDVNIQIFTVEGREVSSKTSFTQTGANRIDLPVSGLKKGLYLVRVSSEGFAATKKLVIE